MHDTCVADGAHQTST